MRKVLVTATNYSRNCVEAKALLGANGIEVVENTFGRPLKPQEIAEVIGDVDGVIAGADTWDEEVFKRAPKLKVIARFGTGCDWVDIAGARRHGIQVTNAPGANANAVADLAISFLLAMMRNLVSFNESVRRGVWDRFVGYELDGKTVGLLGFGAIGQKVARKLQGFSVRILAFDLKPACEVAKGLGVTFENFDRVLRDSDIVSVHLPCVRETVHIIGREQFEIMKDGVLFINTARGMLVDEQALDAALRSGKVRMAAVDVYEHEPPKPDNPLFQLSSIICTPHTGGETYEAIRQISLVTAQAVIDVFAGKTPANLRTA